MTMETGKERVDMETDAIAEKEVEELEQPELFLAATTLY